MLHKIVLKYYIVCACIILSILLVMGGLCSAVLANNVIKDTVSDIQDAATNVASLSGRLPKNGHIVGRQSLENLLSTIKATLDADVILVTEDGYVELTTLKSEERNAERLIADEVALETVLAGKTYGKKGMFLYQQKNNVPSYTVGVPILEDDNRVDGAVFVTTDNIDLMQELVPFMTVYLLFIISALLIAFVIVYFVSLKMFRPLTQMSQAVKKYARGDFSMRITAHRDDELGELATAFNNMADSLDRLEGMRQNFVEDVSHELRTPMTTIGGFVDGILDGVIPTEEQGKYLAIVSAEIQRLSRMVSSMLDVARIQSGTMVYNKTNFDLATLLRRNIDNFSERMEEKNVSLRVDIDPEEDYYIYADSDSVYRVVYNLMDNAMKFVNDGGEIVLECKVQDGFVMASVYNTGEGIPQKEVGQIFDRFYKRDKSRSSNRKGVGIGLYLVKQIVTDLGGDIFVTSKEGKFAKFSFTMPKAEDL